MTIQCMGGWCKQRGRCENYWAAATPGREPVERLCGAEDDPDPIKRQQERTADEQQPA
jgi:hypothetical protein